MTISGLNIEIDGCRGDLRTDCTCQRMSYKDEPLGCPLNLKCINFTLGTK